TRVVGVYSKPAEGALAVTLEGKVIGGELKRETDETVDAAFFQMGALPEPVMAHLHQRVADFREGQPQAFLRTQ
ncbi:MAG: NUDIX hydrolase, partial [Bacillota bacterium]|nr:NUDIX hydrolase [Bacillota bacterium]MDP2871578.1 NUDIX hydrolase [Bacillota bacterium]